jgi:hypothetical protein
MAKRPINYTSREYSSIRNDLVNYAKRYYPTTFQDFNEASFGSLMLDMVAYVGDQLSFYMDYQTNENFIDTALEEENIISIAKQMGYKYPGSARSTGTATFFVEVPVDSATLGPDLDYIPVLQAGSILTSEGGAAFTLIENVDFADSSNEITVAKVGSASGIPTSFAIKGQGKIMSGERFIDVATVGNYERFLKVELERSNVIEVISVSDAEGNEYYEVDYLSQDIVYQEVPNQDSVTKIAVPYKLRAIPAPRRFVSEYDQFGRGFIQFGYGSSENLTSDVIADPSDVVLNVTGRNYITDTTFDPSNLVQSDKFGVVPTNTTLSIVYAANARSDVNAPVGTLTDVSRSNFAFKNISRLDASLVTSVETSLEVNNETPILGDVTMPGPEAIRRRAYSTFATQARAVSRADYINLCYRMPSKFGKIKRVNVVQDRDSLQRNLNLYVLGELNGGNLVAPNSELKTNLQQWLEPRRMLSDRIDILDGKVINLGINFEVLADLDVNRFTLVDSCIQAIIDKYLNVKPNIGDALYISEIYKILNDVPGVTDTLNVEFVNKAGGVYSNYIYDIQKNLSDDGRFLIIPEFAIGEVLLPNSDIFGVIK